MPKGRVDEFEITAQDLLEMQEYKEGEGYSFNETLSFFNISQESPAIALWKLAYETCSNGDALTHIQNLKKSIKPASNNNNAPNTNPNTTNTIVNSSQLHIQPNNLHQPVHLDKVFVIFKCKTQLIEELCTSEFLLLSALIAKLCHKGIQTTSKDQKELSIIEPKTISDAYGLWTYDVLCGQLKIILRMVNSEKPLPPFFSVDGFTAITWGIQPLESPKEKKQKYEDSLPGLVYHVASSNCKSDHDAAIWLRSLQAAGVVNIDDIFAWSEKEWDSCRDLPVEGRRLLRRDVPTYVESLQQERAKNTHKKAVLDDDQRKGDELMQQAINLAEKHKVLRYLHHEVGDGNTNRPYLNLKAVHLGFDAMSLMRDIQRGVIISQLGEFMQDFCNNPELPLTMQQMGLLLYGPPGTGKTKLCQKLALVCGLTQVVEPLASTDMNRPHVGETEEVLKALFFRAKRLPHLLCSIAIDEIDSLTPKRSQKASEHAISALSTILALLGGIKEVRNMFVMASTNRLTVMDDAILRRLSGKFFVGRPTAEQRRETFQHMAKVFSLNATSEVIELLVDLSTNVSGSALAYLRSKVITICGEDRKTDTITREIVVKAASSITEMFQVKIGTFSLPELYKSMRLGKQQLPNMFARMPNIFEFDGRIIVDLAANGEHDGDFEYKNSIQMETSRDYAICEITLPPSVRFTKDIIPQFVFFAKQHDVAYIQLVDADVLCANAAFDDQTIMEILTDRIQECRGYDKSLLLIDLESLVGLTISESTSNMGPSTSYSFSKANLFNWTLDCARRSIVTETTQHWVVVVASQKFTLKTFKAAAKFPLSNYERDQKRIAHDESTKPEKCGTCGILFIPSENKFGQCTYHKRKLVCMLDVGLRHGFDEIPPNESKERFDQYRYECCYASYDPQKRNGCVLDSHRKVEIDFDDI